MTTDTKLLPCPFCGANAHFEVDDARWEWVECESCGMQSNRRASLMEDCKPMLAAAWNTRAKLGQPAHSGEPFAWHVCSVNSDGSLSLEHAAAWEEAAHEHINDAITEHDIEGAGSWVVRPAYHAPQPSPTAQAADSVQEDAARYRWLREGNDAKHGAAWHVAVNLYGCEWDAAIDAAMNKGATP